MLNKVRRYKQLQRIGAGILGENPVLSLGLLYPFVIISSITLKGGLAMCGVIAASTLPCAVLAPLVGRRMPEWLRIPAFSLLSLLCVLSFSVWLGRYPVVLDNLGLYVPMACLNTLMLELSVVHPRKNAGRALLDALRMCLGFALVVGMVAAVREIWSARTLWGMPVRVPGVRMRGMALPFSGFILLGFLSALFRCVDRDVMRALSGPKVRQEEEVG